MRVKWNSLQVFTLRDFHMRPLVYVQLRWLPVVDKDSSPIANIKYHDPNQ
jgi:hypothetical protein